MGVQFILGRSGTGKTRACIESVCAALIKDASSNTPLILLVPEQATYQMERAVLSHPGIEGFSRLRILSFARLIFHLLGSDAGGMELSRAGQQILLQKLLGQMAGELEVFGESAQQPGLAAELAGLLMELQRYAQGPEEIQACIARLEAVSDAGMTARKLRDVTRIYEAYLAAFGQSDSTWCNPEARVIRARQALDRTTWLQGGYLWVDGFAGFTTQELNLLAALLTHMEQTHIALCLDPNHLDLNQRGLDQLDPHSLFASSERTYVQLLQICDGLNLPVVTPQLLQQTYRFAEAQDLARVERCWLEPQVSPVPCQDQIHLHLAPNKRAEVEFVARDIMTRVRQQGLRYRDLAVVVSDLQGYEHLIEAALGDAGIPYFLDRVRTFACHPLVELIQAALHVVESDFSTRDVLAYLKAGLGPLEEDDVHRLEDVTLAWGKEGRHWLSSQSWDKDQPDIETMRKRAVAELRRWYETLRTEEQPMPLTATAFVTSLWQFIESLDLPSKLARWCENDESDRAGHRQLLDKLVHLLDELVAILGNEPLPSDQLCRILGHGLHQLTFKHIPPTLDQVLVGSIERSRHPDLKVLYIMGATQKQFPIPVIFDTILSEPDRTLAESQGLALSESLSQRLAGRQYLAYIAFTRPSQHLTITVPAVNEDGAAVVPSPWVDQLQQLFTNLAWEPTTLQREDWDAIYSSSHLTLRLAETLGRDASLDRKQWQPYSDGLLWLSQHESPPLRQAVACVIKAVTFRNQAVLSQDLAQTLAGESLLCSASRLSCFAACPYQHFARYGLHLEPRVTVQLEPVDVGTLYHDVLERLHHQLQQQGLHWGTVQPEPLHTSTDQCFDDVVGASPQIQRFMEQSPHNAFLLLHARQSLHDCVTELAAMTRASRFVPYAAEIDFGPGGQIPAVTIPGPEGRRIQVRGRIDRLDVLSTENGDMALIIDYKRTSRSFSWPKFYHGLDLQLPVYLLAVSGIEIEQQKIKQGIGAFMIPIEVAVQAGDFSQRQISSFKRKGKGLFHGDYEAALESIEPSTRSRYWSFAKDKNDLPYSYFKNSSALHPNQFDRVQDYCRRLIQDLAGRLLDGDIEVAPYRLGQQSPCGFCDYRSVCKFDWQINDYRVLASYNKEEALAAMEGGNTKHESRNSKQ